jgi:hypothetical protein
MTDIAPTNTNTEDTPQTSIPTKRSHHRKPTQNPNTQTSGLSESEAKTTPRTRNRQARVSSAKLKTVTDGVTSLYATIGIFAYARDQYDGLVIMTTAQDRAIELVNVAKHHKWLMDLLIRLTQSSDYVTLAVGHATLAYALLSHHNQIPKNDALLAQFGYSEQQVFTKAAMMQAQAGQAEQEPPMSTQAQYDAMQQEEPQPANYEGTLYETGNDYDTTNDIETDNPVRVSRLDESTLGAR